jgi:hypothetical protein
MEDRAMSKLDAIFGWLWPPMPGTARYERQEYAEATERWQRINAEKRAAGCPCGKAATRVEYDGSNLGAVPVEQWTCDEHYGTASWSSGPGYFRAAWARPTQCADCPGFCSTMSKIGAARPYEWHCTKQREEAYRIEDPERSTHL